MHPKGRVSVLIDKLACQQTKWSDFSHRWVYKTRLDQLWMWLTQKEAIILSHPVWRVFLGDKPSGPQPKGEGGGEAMETKLSCRLTRHRGRPCSPLAILPSPRSLFQPERQPLSASSCKPKGRHWKPTRKKSDTGPLGRVRSI